MVNTVTQLTAGNDSSNKFGDVQVGNTQVLNQH